MSINIAAERCGDDEVIVAMEIDDVRFPTSLHSHGSDAIHGDPDYSCAYVTLRTSASKVGYGLTFTCGQGTEIVCCALTSMRRLIVGQNIKRVFLDFASFWRSLASDQQLRWLGPEKGVMHLALAAVSNAVWDMWARVEEKPLWRLVAEMPAEVLVSTIDWRYMDNALTKDEALALLAQKETGLKDRIDQVKKEGQPCYTTSCGWLGYTNDEVRSKCRAALAQGFTFFKMKVGKNVEDDVNRAAIIREEIGEEKTLAVDANQVWGVSETIAWMKRLAPYRPYWIEEPTSPDDIIAHKQISEALWNKETQTGIRVATGEQAQNRVIFKQLLQTGAIQVAQIDACRVGGVSENIAILLMAAKFGVAVCPHAGGVGLCELVSHLAMADFARFGCERQGRWCEFCDHLHEHFVDPSRVENGHYLAPSMPGFSCQLKQESLDAYRYPTGSEWQRLFKEGVFKEPAKSC